MEWILVVILTTGDVDITWEIETQGQCKAVVVAEKQRLGKLYQDHKCFAVNEEGGYE